MFYRLMLPDVIEQVIGNYHFLNLKITSVDLMMTVCAGRFTPVANVFVLSNTFIAPLLYAFSTCSRSS